VLDCSAITFTDAQGAATLDELVTVADESGFELRLARLRPAVRAVLDRDGVVDRIGADRIHPSVDQAVQAHTHSAGDPPTSPSPSAG
jgi:SulP family sulfate permease